MKGGLEYMNTPDAFDRMSQLIEQNSEMTVNELCSTLVSEGYAKSEESLHKFFKVIGIED